MPAFSAQQPLVRAGATAGQRQLITTGVEQAREIERAQVLETKTALRVLGNKVERAGSTLDPDQQKLVIDLLEHSVEDSDNFLSIRKLRRVNLGDRSCCMRFAIKSGEYNID